MVIRSAPLLGEPLPVELMNTIWADRAGVHDALATADSAGAWLSAVTDRMAIDVVADPRTGSDALGLDALGPDALGLVPLRDALRVLAAHATADTRTRALRPGPGLDAALGTVNAAAAGAPSWTQLSWAQLAPTRLVRGPEDAPRQVRHFAGTAGEAARAWIAEEAIELFTGPKRQELRACLAPGCVLYFVRDHARRHWCSAGCGNRARQARHYQRHRPHQG